MKTTIQSLLVAAVLAAASAAAAAGADGTTATHGATSVTEMMQHKHEHQLRDELAADGRWDQVRQLDAENASELREEQQEQLVKANAALAHASAAGGRNQDPLLNECDPDKLPR